MLREKQLSDNPETRKDEMNHIYIRGDVHGNIDEISRFVSQAKTSLDDLLIILGDAGFNYYVHRQSGKSLYQNDGNEFIHRQLARLPLTIAVVQGNHEAPAWLCEGMREVEFCHGRACQSEEAPNVFYLRNGEIYTINNRTFLCMGGAYSVDKRFRSVPYAGWTKDARWFPEEQMSDEEFALARKNLEKANHSVDFVLSHTCPVSKMPLEMLMKGIPDADDRMENLFEEIQNEFDFKKWYFGHFHTDRWIDDRFRILYRNVIEPNLEDE